MLLVADKISELSIEQLTNVYGKNQAVIEYIQQDFFVENGTLCCVWQDHGKYYSVLRLEPYLDGVLITGLETDPTQRRRGYGRRLMQSVIDYLSDKNLNRVYSHIEKRNKASIALHQQIGFVQILDYAKYIDGTVSANSATFVLNI